MCIRDRGKGLEGTGRGTGGKIKREERAGAHRGKEKGAEETGGTAGKDTGFGTAGDRHIGCIP